MLRINFTETPLEPVALPTFGLYKIEDLKEIPMFDAMFANCQQVDNNNTITMATTYQKFERMMQFLEYSDIDIFLSDLAEEHLKYWDNLITYDITVNIGDEVSINLEQNLSELQDVISRNHKKRNCRYFEKTVSIAIIDLILLLDFTNNTGELEDIKEDILGNKKLIKIILKHCQNDANFYFMIKFLDYDVDELYGQNLELFQNNYDKITRLCYVTKIPGDIAALLCNVKKLHLTDGFKNNLNIFEKMTAITELKMENFKTTDVNYLYPIKNLINLEILDLGECRNNTKLKIDFLKTLKNLRILKFNGDYDQPLDPLANLENLETIEFSSDFNQSLKPLAKLKKLIKISLGSDFNQPLDALESLQNLEIINFSDYRGRFNYPLDPLINLHKLTKLRLPGDFNQSLQPLYLLPNLEELIVNEKFKQKLEIPGNYGATVKPFPNLKKLKFCGHITTEITFLAALENLKELIFEGDIIVSLQPLTSLNNLEKLYFYDNCYPSLPADLVPEGKGDQDWEFLTQLHNLRKLQLPRKFVGPFPKDLSSLQQLTHITFSQHSKFNQSLEPLASLKNLQEIDFNKKFNQSLGPLANLKNLEKICLREDFNKKFNQSLGPLANLKNLEKICLREDFNQSLNPLANLENLEEISFGYESEFNQPLDKNKAFSKSLQQIYFPNKFNQDISGLASATGLKKISFSYKFDQDINILFTLPNIESIVMYGSFNTPLTYQPVVNSASKLEYLQFNNFNQSLDIFQNIAPMLQKLSLPKCFNQSLQPLTELSKLKNLYLHQYKNEEEIKELQRQCTNLKIDNSNW